MDKRLSKIENETNKMSNHIDFVENIYDKIKMPFHYILGKISHVANKELEN